MVEGAAHCAALSPAHGQLNANITTFAPNVSVTQLVQNRAWAECQTGAAAWIVKSAAKATAEHSRSALQSAHALVIFNRCFAFIVQEIVSVSGHQLTGRQAAVIEAAKRGFDWRVTRADLIAFGIVGITNVASISCAGAALVGFDSRLNVGKLIG